MENEFKECQKFVENVLKNTFNSLDDAGVARLLDSSQSITLSAGDVLFSEGEIGDALYLVITGRLQVYTNNGDDIYVLNELGSGQTVGELALFTEATRTASVRAMRLTHLLKIIRPTFLSMMTAQPALASPIMLAVIQRILAFEQQKRHIKDQVTNLFLLFDDNLKHKQWFIDTFKRSLSQFETVHLIDDAEISDQDLNEYRRGSFSLNTLRKLDNYEQQYQKVVYIDSFADNPNDQRATAWNELAANHADRIIIVTDTSSSPTPSTREQQILSHAMAEVEVVLLYPPQEDLTTTAQYLKPRKKIRRTHHIATGNDRDIQRLARYLNVHAVGLVLGGGAARGLAHLGLIKAFVENHIAIDAIGGTSIGALYACVYASGMPIEKIEETSRWAFTRYKPLNDYTFPSQAVLKGKKLDKVLHKVYGDKCLEDCIIRCFCVAGNLTQSKGDTIRQGTIWKAVRASLSLPGILPPVEINGDRLVDGGVVNNFPVDIMSGGGIGTVVGALPTREILDNSNISSAGKSMKLTSILYRSALLGSDELSMQNQNSADYFIPLPMGQYNMLDFHLHDDIVDFGYHFTLDWLEKLDSADLARLRGQSDTV